MLDDFSLTDPIALTQALIRCASVTPEEAGVMGVTVGWLEALGFVCHRAAFAEAGTAEVQNLYARLGSGGPNFCFAGHLDVVPVGDAAKWRVPPFSGEIASLGAEGEVLIGRGACDMKGAIGAFIAAVARVKARRGPARDAWSGGSVSLLLTLDEEGPAINGTRKMLEWMAARGERLDACLVGEPTSDKTFGDTVKIGRRGSVNCHAVSRGKQGHVAYPALAENPIPALLRFLHAVTSEPLDNGTKFFPPTNLEVTSLDVGNPTHNIIPASAEARLNIRFNDQHTGAELADWLEAHARAAGGNLALEIKISGEAFLTPPGDLSALVADAVAAVTGLRPRLSTSGGTSDARFIKDYCPVVEFGARNETAHQVDERLPLGEIEALCAVYETVLEKYFAAA